MYLFADAVVLDLRMVGDPAAVKTEGGYHLQSEAADTEFASELLVSRDFRMLRRREKGPHDTVEDAYETIRMGGKYFVKRISRELKEADGMVRHIGYRLDYTTREGVVFLGRIRIEERFVDPVTEEAVRNKLTFRLRSLNCRKFPEQHGSEE
jgi:hypothetical protein